MHTKDETIAFLGYLKRKDPIVLESDEHYEPSESTFTVSEHDASKGAFNGYRIEAEKWKRMMGEAKLRENLEDNRIFVGYDSSKHALDNEILIAIAKLICESSPITQVRFCDYATLKTLVVRKNDAGIG